MLFKALTVATLFTAAFAASEQAQNVEKRQAGGVPADVGGLISLIPQSVLTAFLANPTGAQFSILEQIQAGSTPGWIASLPTGVQQSLGSAFGVTGAAPTPTAALSSASGAVSSALMAGATGASGAAANATSSMRMFVGNVSIRIISPRTAYFH